MIEEVSTPYRDGEAGPVSGYGTRFVFVLPEGAKGAEVSAFYEQRLRENWQVVEQLDGPVLTLRRGRASASINLEGWQGRTLEVSVDHAAYDGGG